MCVLKKINKIALILSLTLCFLLWPERTPVNKCQRYLYSISLYLFHLSHYTPITNTVLSESFYLEVVEKAALLTKTAVRKVNFQHVYYWTNLMIFNEIRLLQVL